ncbi:MAG: TIGR00701 family protein [Haliea sp.]|nr:TIGR00701 family protein [Haliea sp.]|tara:strand:+ start:1846 stop:2265 length:420 start_codon:yes stop_codon:yes gene_type:complete
MYLWLKAFHLIFMVCWFAGLFYLPRLLVHYADCEHPDTRARLALMARKLYRFVTPFLFLTVGFGVSLLVLLPGHLQAGWLWLKLAGVAFLVGYHIQCGRYVRAVNEDRDRHSHVYYRFFNEIPVLFLFAIILLAILKPF